MEDLFLKGFDTLKALIEALQGPFGLREEDAQQTVSASEPTFVELQKYLQRLMSQEAASLYRNVNQIAIAPNAAAQINTILRAMLQLFKQPDSTKSRQQLVALCNRLIQISATTKPWVTVLQAAQRAIAIPKNAYSALAPIVIRDLKQASDLLLAGRVSQIIPSQHLRQLIAPAQAPRSVPQAALQPISQATSRQTTSRQATATRSQIAIPLEPRAAARTLLEVFNKSELIEIAEFLMKAIQ